MRRLCVTLVRRLCDGYLPKAAEARYVNGGPSSHCIVWCIIAAAAPRRAWPQLHARAHVCVHTSTLVRAYTYRLLVSCSMQEPSVFSFIISQFLSTFTGDLPPPAHITSRACERLWWLLTAALARDDCGCHTRRCAHRRQWQRHWDSLCRCCECEPRPCTSALAHDY